MPQKGFSLILLLLFCTTIVTAVGYFFSINKDNPDFLLGRPANVKDFYEAREKVARENGNFASNPATEYCIKVGADLESKTRPDGLEYTVCTFGADKACEQWALYNRECPQKGADLSGLATNQQVYCAILGGKEEGLDCKLPKNKTCPLKDLYKGKCKS